MALLLLAHRWTENHGGKTVALTVDHGLRGESAQEAQRVASWCAERGIIHHILVWQPPSGLHSGIQEAAREARYRLMTAWCRQNTILHLLTAHHRDDQAETLLFRVARGSGIDGLACIPSLSFMHGVRLLRPLLAFAKTALKTFLSSTGQAWVEDPSNSDTRYARTAIRSYLITVPEEFSQEASRLCTKFAKIRNLMENNAVKQLTHAISLHPEAYALLCENRFRQLAPDHGLRALASLVHTISGTQTPSRSERIQLLYNDLLALPTRRTFGNCVFEYKPGKRHFLVRRETNAMQPALPLRNGETCLWDNRFELHWSSPSAQESLTVAPLGARGLDIVGKTRLPRAAASELPALWNLEELVCVPHMNYTNPTYAGLVCRARYFPAKALAGWAFFCMNVHNLNRAQET